MPSLYWSLKLRPYMNSQIENGPLFVISWICFLNGYLDMWGGCILVFQFCLHIQTNLWIVEALYRSVAAQNCIYKIDDPASKKSN